MSDVLVVMRLADMTKVHPKQDSTRICDACSTPVGIYPTGLAALAANPTLAIRCQVCAFRERKPGDFDEAAGSIDEILREMRESIPLPKGGAKK